MTKYIDAEKLRKEIERLDKSNTVDLNNGCDDDQCYGYYLALSDLINSLDSLQQEQPEVDLEEEADRLFFSLGWYEGDHDKPMLDCISLEEFRGIARHFAKWGAEHLKK